MPPQGFVKQLLEAITKEDAWAIVEQLKPVPPENDPNRLYDIYDSSNEQQIGHEVYHALRYARDISMPEAQANAWSEIITAFWRALRPILQAHEAKNHHRLGDRSMVGVYDAWKAFASSLHTQIDRGNLPPWAVVLMYHSANHLRIFAIKADEQIIQSRGNVTSNLTFQDDDVSTKPTAEKLPDAIRLFNKMFSSCMGDRNPDMRESRKWGTYYMANLQFKSYFKLNNVPLSKNVVRAIEAQKGLPDFTTFPASHRVTYKYYVGVLSFVQEDYPKAEACLQGAWNDCLPSSYKNRELILTYLIPCCLITKHIIPTNALLSGFPSLQKIFGPLINCIKRGDPAGFDKALLDGRKEFVKRRIFLTLERGRDIAMRNLLRKVYIAQGFEDLKEGQTEAHRIRKSRIPLSHFAVALRMGLGGESRLPLEDAEVECMLANMVYKGLMKGYVSREHSMVVLNKKGAFPDTGV